MSHNRANVNWRISDGAVCWEEVHAAILMDIRDHLVIIRNRVDCWETKKIPRLLEAIKRQTYRPPPKKFGVYFDPKANEIKVRGTRFGKPRGTVSLGRL